MPDLQRGDKFVCERTGETRTVVRVTSVAERAADLADAGLPPPAAKAADGQFELVGLLTTTDDAGRVKITESIYAGHAVRVVERGTHLPRARRFNAAVGEFMGEFMNTPAGAHLLRVQFPTMPDPDGGPEFARFLDEVWSLMLVEFLTTPEGAEWRAGSELLEDAEAEGPLAGAVEEAVAKLIADPEFCERLADQFDAEGAICQSLVKWLLAGESLQYIAGEIGVTPEEVLHHAGIELPPDATPEDILRFIGVDLPPDSTP